MSDLILIAGNSGSGKTGFAVNLAYALSGFKNKVLFFDGDLGLGNINAQLGLNIQDGLDSVINDKATLNQVVIKGYFDILTSKSGSLNLANVPLGRLQILSEDLNILAENYDKLILDMGHGSKQIIRNLTARADNIILICTNDKSSLVESYNFLSIINKPVNIVINKAASLQEGQRTYDTIKDACRRFLDVAPALLGVVREDARFRDSLRNKTTIISRYPTSDASEDIINIARKLNGKY